MNNNNGFEAVAQPRTVEAFHGRRPGIGRVGRALFAFAAMATIIVGARAALLSVPTPVKVMPVSVVVHSASMLPAEVRALEAQTVSSLFDRDTYTDHVAYGDEHVETRLERPTEIQSIKVYGPAPYELTVQALQGGTWTTIPGLDRIKLANLSNAWHKFDAAQTRVTDALRFQLTQASGNGNGNGNTGGNNNTSSNAVIETNGNAGGQGNGNARGGNGHGNPNRNVNANRHRAAAGVASLREIEIWGIGAHGAVTDGTSLVAAMQSGTPAPQGRQYAATPKEGVIGINGPRFQFTLDRSPGNFKRAYLAYEVYGLMHWVSPVRRINGQVVQGGAFVFSGRDWTPVNEPIDPNWLAQGANAVDFSLPPGLAGSYSVRNVRLVLELDDGNNFVAGVHATVNGTDADVAALIDGDAATGWSPYSASNKGKTDKPAITLHFEHAAQPQSMSLYLANALSGNISVDMLVGSAWQSAGMPAINGRKLVTGWNTIAIPTESAVSALRLTFQNGSGSAEIREVMLTGSPVGQAYAPAIVVGYPDAGQFYGRKAYIRGFLASADNGSGAPILSIGGKQVVTSDGSFGVAVSKDDTGFAKQSDSERWQVEIDAVYPDGEKLTQIVPLFQANDAQKAHGGLPAVAVPGYAMSVDNDGAQMEVDPDALDRPVDLRITPLAEKELPALDPGMTNVTGKPGAGGRGARGYRFTPHGTKFKKHIKVTLPFDPALVPAGMTHQDIKTFFFDEQQGRWVELGRYKLDSNKGLVTSLTDHFTDMINATLVVPDHPQTMSYNPTQIKDIKAADPGAQVNLIEPPQVNNSGDARLAYPIELPPGRLGLAPQLAVQYNSSGGNGWMGIGWDLPMQAITIDTRWGVPRYDGALETETYTLSGEQLTPLAHRGELQPRKAEKVFHSRVEGGFRKIVRHGDNPKNYWWEVTDKNGTRYFYGGNPETGADSGAREKTLTDAGGNVFLWALCEIRDTHGNFVRYRGVHVSDTGVPGGSVPGDNLYLKKISYTGSNGNEGAYNVTFVRDRELGEARRPDVQIDGRGGFKRVTADLLRKVEVRFNDQMIRSYDFAYEEGPFHKILLKTVSQFGQDGQFFNKHAFAYYDEARDGAGAYKGFEGASDWNIPGDGVTVGMFGRGQASAIGGTKGKSTGGHLYVGVGGAGDVTSKKLTVGFKVGYSQSESETLLTMSDMNGDGLPDKVFKGGGFHYRPNLSGPKGSPRFGDKVQLPTLPAIGREKVTSTTAGVELYPVVTVTLDMNRATTRGDTYFSDVNGDGLTDLVSGGQVLFGYINAGGVPTFTSNSALTPVAIGPSLIDTNGLLPDASAIEAENAANFPLLDTLRRWVAPYDGTIHINAPVQLIKDTSAERAEYATADGVRVAIQLEASELWSATIGATDYQVHTPSGLTGIRVKRGDRIYFRVQSIFDGMYDQVAWDPVIGYDGVTAPTDVNGLDPYAYQASKDFVLAGRQGSITAPVNGTLHLGGTLQKTGATTDDVTLSITKNGTEIYRKAIGFADTATVTLSQDIAVKQLDQLQWRILVDSPIDATLIKFTPAAWYTAAEGVDQLTDEQGNYVMQLSPPYDIDTYSADLPAVPQTAWKATATGTVTIQPSLNFNFASTPPALARVVFTVKRRGALLAKRTINIANGVLPAPATLAVSLAVTKDDELFFDFSTLDTTLAASLASQSVTVDGSAVPSAFHSAVAETMFARPYRGWGAIGYNGNDDRATKPVVQSLLAPVIDKDTDPKTIQVYPFIPVPAKSAWGGLDESAWVSAGQESASRLGLKNVTMPRSEHFAGAGAPTRISRSDNKALGVSLARFGASSSRGSSQSQIEFMDLNGDRFPDVIGGGVQYTRMVGGLESSSRSSGAGNSRSNQNETSGAGYAGNISVAISNSKGKVAADGGAGGGNAGNLTTGVQATDMPSLGFSANISAGKSEADYDLIDINADGLPDKVYKNGTASLNLGYIFAAAEPWGGGEVNKGRSLDAGGGLSMGFNRDDFSWGGGLSLGIGKSKTEETYVDVNGDGLPDKVTPGSPISVRLNTGSGFTGAIAWPHSHDELALDKHASLGGGAYFTYGFTYFGLAKIVINPGVNFSTSMGRPEYAFRDMDGDGFVDHVRSSNDGQLTVANNQIGRTNLLKHIDRPLGATVDLEYTRDGNIYDMPQSRWLMTKVTVFDGHTGDGVDQLVTTYRYEAPKYNRLERDFYGYGKVIEEQRDENAAVYRSVTHAYRTDSYYTKGVMVSELMAAGSGAKFVETEHTYELRDVSTGQTGTDVDAASTTATLFPMLARTDRRFYEGQGAAGKATYTTHEYDALGNVSHFADAGDPGAADDVEALVNYSAAEAACQANHIVGLATRIDVIGAGNLMRSRSASIDCKTGDLLQVRQALDAGQAAVTDLAYAPNGNLTRVTGPANAKGQRYALDYEHDPVVATHVTAVSDSFGYRSTSTTNFLYGRTDSTTDLNSNVIATVYDTVGRIASITGPYEQGGPHKTLAFDYHPEAAHPWARTHHYDRDAGGRPQDPIETVLFTDGINRVLQTKKDAAVAGKDVMIVSGAVVFDAFGRTVSHYYPITEPLGQGGTFNPGRDSVQPTTMAYDVLDRNLQTTIPDNTSTTLAYGFGTDADSANQFRTIVTDANGNQKESYRNVRDLITTVREFNPVAPGQAVLTTRYRYDPLKQIVQVVDAKGNTTKATHDLLGRRTTLDNPDTGKTQTRYDLASNVIQKVTANLAATGRAIDYDYDFNRLAAIRYPHNKGNDVGYDYGDPAAKQDNRAGRIVKVSDASGTEERFYGKLGETVKEIKTFASHTQGQSKNSPEVYTTSYQYDTFNRLMTLTVPDRETVTYAYDSGGNLAAFAGDKDGDHYDYLLTLHYDKFEQRSYLQLGNGIETRYAYRPDNRRLQNLTSDNAQTVSGPMRFQNLGYRYDKVGNITDLANDIATPLANTFGGPTQHHFTYDNLYRLTAATGNYAFAPDKQRHYTLAMAYDGIHNIVHKTQLDTITQPGGQAITQKNTSYDWNYAYASAHPHAPTHLGERTFSYDPNGNQTGWTHDQNGTRRHILWDEENRIQQVEDNGHRMRYVYNDHGERVAKIGPQGETVYVNPNYTVRNRSIVSKHFYAGTTRLVTQLVPGNGNTNNVRGQGGTKDNGNGGQGQGQGQGGGKDQPHPDNHGNAYAYGHDKNGGGGSSNGGASFEGEGVSQGVAHRSENGNEHAKNTEKNPHFTGEAPGQGGDNRSARATEVANNTAKTPNAAGTTSASSNPNTGTTDSASSNPNETNLAGAAWNPEQTFLYFYHPDHLGTTGYVTDQNAKLYEHLEYFPFGETWVQEHSNIQRTPYLFTGKELDEETQLYYYGARYYDPRTSVWQSADPILEKYLGSHNDQRLNSPNIENGWMASFGLPGNGGVFNTINLALYSYSHQNPVRFNDPDGREVIGAEEARKIYGKGTSGKGHHWVPFQSIAQGLDISPEARSVFGQSVSGEKLPGNIHKWDENHVKYNKAITEELKAFAKDNNIDLEKMTAKEAEGFVSHVKTSNHPDIKPLVKNIDVYNARAKIYGPAGKTLLRAFTAIGVIELGEKVISTKTDACKATNCAGEN